MAQGPRSLFLHHYHEITILSITDTTMPTTPTKPKRAEYDTIRRTRFFNKPCCENAMPCAQVNPGHKPLSQQTERQCSVNGTSAPLLLQKGVPLQSHAWQPTIMHPDGKTEHGGHAHWVCIHTTAEICELQACHDGLVAQIQCALAGNTVVAACLQVATVRQ